MTTTTNMRQLTPELEQIRFDAMRYCDEHGVDDSDALGRIMGAMAHKAFLENIEPYTKAMANLMAHGTGAIRQHVDGSIEYIPQQLPADMQKTFDDLIENERRRFSLQSPV